MKKTTHKYEFDLTANTKAGVIFELNSDNPSAADSLFRTLMDVAYAPQIGYGVQAGDYVFRLDDIIIRPNRCLEYHFIQEHPRPHRYESPPDCGHIRTRIMSWPDGGDSEVCERCLLTRHLDAVVSDWQDHGYNTIADWYIEASKFQEVMNGLEGSNELPRDDG